MAVGTKPIAPFSTADIGKRDREIEMMRFAGDIGKEAGRLLFHKIKDMGDEQAIQRELLEARKDARMTLLWRGFRVAVTNPASATLVLPPWIMDALYNGIGEGVNEAKRNASSA